MITKISIILCNLLVAITLTGAEQSKLAVVKVPIVRTEGTGSLGLWIRYTKAHATGAFTIASFFSKTCVYNASFLPSNGIGGFEETDSKAVYNSLEQDWKLQQQKLSTQQNPAQKAMPNNTENATIKK